MSRLSDAEAVLSMVSRRTVYTEAEINEMIEEGTKGVLVICFDVIEYFRKPVGMNDLKLLGISPPQSIREIDDAAFASILEAGR